VEHGNPTDGEARQALEDLAAERAAASGRVQQQLTLK
jgi:hypothetical protein